MHNEWYTYMEPKLYRAGVRLQDDWGEIVAPESSIPLGSPEGDKYFTLDFCNF